MIILLHGVILMAFIPDVSVITPTDKQITYTFHRYRKSWNKAQAVCEALGGTLFIEDSQEKATVMATYRDSTSWDDPVSFDVWIGLHSLEIDSSYTWVYGKPTCLPVDDSLHSHWSSGEPKNEDTSRCAVQDMNSGEWTVRKCQWTIYKFICEKQESTSCTFTATTGTPKSSLASQYETQTLSKSDATSCRDECLSSVYNNLNCWAATYEVSSCVLYYMIDPFLLTDGANVDSSSKQLFLKNCYISAVDTTDDTTVSSGNYATPDEGCTSVLTTTTAPVTTTTTTSSTSSTTTPVTTPPPTTTTSTTTTTLSPTTITSSATTSSSSSSAASVTSPVTSPTTGGSSSTVSASSTGTSASSFNPLSSSSSIGTSTAGTALPGSTLSMTSGTSDITNSTNELVTTTVLDTSTDCSCSCNDVRNLYRNFSINPEYANLTTDEIVEKIIERLKVNKSSLSATIRKKTSAEDNRTSSVSVGVVAIIFMTLVFGFLSAADGINFVRYIIQKLKTSSSDDMEMT